MLNKLSDEIRVAVIGAGLAGASCTFGLKQAGLDVTVFEASGQLGGRMANRQALWSDATGAEHSFSFDHAAQLFAAVRPRFRSVMERAVAAGHAAPWQPMVHAAPWVGRQEGFVATPSGAAFCAQLLGGATVLLERNVRRLQRSAEGAWYVACEGAALAGPFEHIVLAVPPAQAAVLLAGHHDDWAAALMERRMEPGWTLTAITDEVDWPWDAAVPERGPLARVVRNDRLPGRAALPGLAAWTAYASAEWSSSRMDADAQGVMEELQAALRAQLPTQLAASLPEQLAFAGREARPWQFHHVSVQRWRHAACALHCDDIFASDDALWDAALGLGVCGDWLAGAGVEAAWQSGDELADTMAASLDAEGEQDAQIPHKSPMAKPDPARVETAAVQKTPLARVAGIYESTP
jgi:renalase